MTLLFGHLYCRTFVFPGLKMQSRSNVVFKLTRDMCVCVCNCSKCVLEVAM